MHWDALISPAATVLVGSAAWFALHLDRKRKHEADERRWAAVDAKLTGRPAVLDNNGKPIIPEVKSFSAELAEVKADLLARPALNGEWTEMRRDVRQLKAWTKVHDEKHDTA